MLIKYARGGSTLDPVAIDPPIQGITTKVGIDATRPLNSDVSRFRKGGLFLPPLI
ncbi:hypothetical protein [Vulcanisaeta distributa]|uniref:hypothetical protein n=1 Tax=Vulcanisaeta distributa TaxID=164451 RepID=UPI000AEB8F08|nr:hypothetical protein [Vulcanisaeta distributa]